MTKEQQPLSPQQRDMVLITDIGSVDPDDTFALVMAATSTVMNLRGVVASHHYPERKAKIAKLILNEIGKDHIKVYVGRGVGYKSDAKEYTDEDKKLFRQQNSHFPKMFGDPTENTWFPNFARAYYDEYGSTEGNPLSGGVETMDGLKIESESAKVFLNGILRQYSPRNRLVVVCIAPPHDLLDIDLELYQNMELYIMGGGFEDIKTIYSMSRSKVTREGSPKSDRYAIKNVGYNFGICPEIVSQLLSNLSVTGQRAVIVSSELVRRNDTLVPLDLYNQWFSSYQGQEKSLNCKTNYSFSSSRERLSKTVMTDWIFSNRGNRLREHKNLCDPLAYILAEDGLFESIDFEMRVNEKSFCGNYLQSQDMLEIQLSQNSNIRLVTNFNKTEVNKDILARIQSVLF